MRLNLNLKGVNSSMNFDMKVTAHQDPITEEWEVRFGKSSEVYDFAIPIGKQESVEAVEERSRQLLLAVRGYFIDILNTLELRI